MPKAIALALSFTYVAGWLYNIVLTFCMGGPASILASPIGQPVVQIFYNVMGKGPAIFFAIAAFIIMNFVCITAMQAGSRTIWAFSRDRMLPLSHIWHRVWSRTDTPVTAVWIYTLLCVLINLIGLGSYITIAAIFNVCAIALDWSYCIPILCKLLFNRFEPGPWNLGRASKFVNIYAIAWTSFVSVIFLFPTVMPVKADNVCLPLSSPPHTTSPRTVHLPLGPYTFPPIPAKLTNTPKQMNYAIVILAFVLLFSTGYWFLHGRNYYTGPRTHANLDSDGAITVAESDVKPSHMHEKKMDA